MSGGCAGEKKHKDNAQRELEEQKGESKKSLKDDGKAIVTHNKP